MQDSSRPLSRQLRSQRDWPHSPCAPFPRAEASPHQRKSRFYLIHGTSLKIASAVSTNGYKGKKISCLSASKSNEASKKNSGNAIIQYASP